MFDDSYLWYTIPLAIKICKDLTKYTYNTIYYVVGYGIVPIGRYLIKN